MTRRRVWAFCMLFIALSRLVPHPMIAAKARAREPTTAQMSKNCQGEAQSNQEQVKTGKDSPEKAQSDLIQAQRANLFTRSSSGFRTSRVIYSDQFVDAERPKAGRKGPEQRPASRTSQERHETGPEEAQSWQYQAGKWPELTNAGQKRPRAAEISPEKAKRHSKRTTRPSKI